MNLDLFLSCKSKAMGFVWQGEVSLLHPLNLLQSRGELKAFSSITDLNLGVGKGASVELLSQDVQSGVVRSLTFRLNLDKDSEPLTKARLRITGPDIPLPSSVTVKALTGAPASLQLFSKDDVLLCDWSQVTETPVKTDVLDNIRHEVSVTTNALATDAISLMTVPAGASSVLLNMKTSVPAEIRLYATAAARTSDAARASTTNPAAGSGLLYQGTTTTGQLSIPCTPTAMLFNMDNPSGSVVYASIKNKNLSASPVKLTLTRLLMEL